MLSNQELIDRVRAEIDEDEIICKLNKEYDVYSLLSFDEFNIKERIEKNAYLGMLFGQRFIQEERRLNTLKDLYDALRGKKYKEYKEGPQKYTKTEIEIILPDDPDIRKLQKAIRKQEIVTSIFQLYKSAFTDQKYNFKQFIDKERGGF